MILASRFDGMITDLEVKNGYQSDSSNQDFKTFPEGVCPDLLDGCAFGVPFEACFAKGP